MKKILIAYGSIGLGHKIVSENIASALKTHPEIEVQTLDLMELYRGPFLAAWSKFYEAVIAHIPGLWGFFYANRLFHKLALPLRIPFAGLKIGKFRSYVRTAQPDLILTAHPDATALAVYLKKRGEFQGPVVTTFSDFHFQPFWAYPDVDRYLVMTEEQKQELTRRGFRDDQIVVTGLPVDPVFVKDYDESAVRRRFGLSRTKPLVVVMGGSRGWGIKLSDVQALLNSQFQMQIVAVSGLNPQLHAKLESLAVRVPDTLKVFAHWSAADVAQLFSIARLLITKPGGLTIAQALMKGLPMILVNPLPTMEELNQQFLVSHGAAAAARNSRELCAWVDRLLQDRNFYQELKTRMRKLTRHQAAEAAAEAVIDTLPG